MRKLIVIAVAVVCAVLAAPAVARGQGTLLCGQSQDGRLTGAEVAQYTFDGVAGEIVLLNVGTTDNGNVVAACQVLCVGGFDPRIELLDPNGNKLAGPTTSIRFKLPVTALYSVLVSDADKKIDCNQAPFKKGYGEYRLALERFFPQVRQCSGRLFCGQWIPRRRLYSADRDLWNICGQKGDRIRLTLQTIDRGGLPAGNPCAAPCQGTFNAELKLYPPGADAPNGQPIPEVDEDRDPANPNVEACPAASEYCFTLPANGIHTVQVYNCPAANTPNCGGNFNTIPCKGWGEYSLSVLWTFRAAGPPLCDCNENGVEDGAEINANTDANGNKVLDVCEAVDFRRGDANGDGRHNIADPIFTICSLFCGWPGPGCRDAADANDDGFVDLTDAIYSLGCLFRGTACPPPPFPLCGPDPKPNDFLTCFIYTACP